MTLLLLSIASHAFAAPSDCALVPVDGSEAAAFQALATDRGRILASWDAVADCPDVPALDGRTFQLDQGLDLALQNGRTVSGTAEVLVRVGDRSVRVAGTVHGTLASNDRALTLDLDVLAIAAHALTLDLDVLANTQVRLAPRFEIDRATGEVLSFKPADADIATTGQ